MRINREELKKKGEFIKRYSEAIRADDRSGVDWLRYEIYEQWDYIRETLLIRFKTGEMKKVDITGNSNLAIMEDAIREIYK